jgi:Uma2 family endonuclease
MSAPVAQGSPLTAESAWALDPPGCWELIEGRLVFMSPAGARHGRVVARVTRALVDFVDARRLGMVLAGDVGFVVRRDPDTVRAPDVAFLSAARLPEPPPAEFVSGAPDLAIEILSPSDRWSAVDEKAAEFVAAGALAVWAIDPGQEKAKIYTSAGSRSLSRTDALSCPELLGAFELRLLDVWS